MNQEKLFEIETVAVEAVASACREVETIDDLSRVPDDDSARRLVSLAEHAQRSTDPLDRARFAAEARDLAEQIVEATIREVNAAGVTWREIGAPLDVPFQTLHRRYGGG